MVVVVVGVMLLRAVEVEAEAEAEVETMTMTTTMTTIAHTGHLGIVDNPVDLARTILALREFSWLLN